MEYRPEIICNARRKREKRASLGNKGRTRPLLRSFEFATPQRFQKRNRITILLFYPRMSSDVAFEQSNDNTMLGSDLVSLHAAEALGTQCSGRSGTIAG